MIALIRLPEPAKLSKNKEKWRVAYLKKREKNPALRPDARWYGCQEVRDTLTAMSFGKCFYCERKLDETTAEVEHYIEVAEDPALAFVWHNLYLSCYECNRRKLPNQVIPASDCLNPCDPSENPTNHLTFDSEYIRPLTGSFRGEKTIQKYRLDRDQLDHLRVKQLQQFDRFLRELRERQLRDGGRPLTELEKEAIASFKQPDHAFSLMFSVYLARLEL